MSTALAPLAGAAEEPVACAPATHAGGEWRSYGHDLSNTRHQQAEKVIGPTVAPTLEPAFTVTSKVGGGNGDFSSTPIIADGCLFSASNGGWVYAWNADTGALVWAKPVPSGGGVNASVAVEGGRLFAAVSKVSKPYVVAFDQRDGTLLWQRQTDSQTGADVYGSPVVFDDMVFIGVSGGSAELAGEDERYPFQGAFVLLEAETGEILKKTWVIREPDADPANPKDDFAGATVWSTPAIDPATKTAYVGTGNPFRPQAEHKNANSIIKIDVDRLSPTFGKILDNYKGSPDEYVDGFDELPCGDIDGNPPPWYPQGVGACGDLDLDFGAAPNLSRASDGRLLVGAGQKSGLYHQVDAATMDGEWAQLVGPPSAVGGIVGSTAFDGSSIYGPIVPAGYLFSLDATRQGAPRWLAPVADGAHWGNPVSVANGVAYTVDLKGFIDAYDARTGVPLLHRPLKAGSNSGTDPMLSWGGVSIARNTVYASLGTIGLATGYIVALRPSTTVTLPDPGPTPDPGPMPKAGTVIATGPSAKLTGYATPAAVTRQGSPVTYVNLDIERHDVVHQVTQDPLGAGPATNPWCSDYQAGKCPAFWTPLTALGEQAELQGLAGLTPGRTYPFYCTLHPGMKGTLVSTP